MPDYSRLNFVPLSSLPELLAGLPSPQNLQTASVFLLSCTLQVIAFCKYIFFQQNHPFPTCCFYNASSGFSRGNDIAVPEFS
jgi:hypothetical protein